ncbi:MAG TPA: rhomboid family intramembrane serine protease [Thermoanaerobaculia bacterium]|jgi:rhomboid protease GluP|nr:rhomboid family intramembrane serine protease [Thermoanaerobaculia bacterium]
MRFPVTISLVALIVCGFVVQLFVPGVIEAGAVMRDGLERGEMYRLLTATLLHAGIVHLVLNAWMLLQVGSVFELFFGSVKLIVLYLASAIIASGTSAVHLEAVGSVGASGAIFGVMGGLLVMMGTLPPRQRWAGSLRMQLAVWAAVSMGLGFISDGVDNAAHVGGFIAGVLVALVFRTFHRNVTVAPRARPAA